MAKDALVQCHANLTSNRSICDLPCTDYVRVFWTIKNSIVGQVNITAAKFSALEAISCLTGGASEVRLTSNLFVSCLQSMFY